MQLIFRSAVLLMCLSLTACDQIPLIGLGRPEAAHPQRRSSDRGEARISHKRSTLAMAPRPRLMVTADDFAKTKELIQSDPTARQWFATLKQRADAMVDRRSSKKDTDKLLLLSRQTLLHTSSLGAMYQLTGDERYAHAAIAEMLEVCRFRDWHPDDEFLATSEMTTAVAVGYDWVNSVMTSAERDEILDALIDKGINAGLEAYDKKMGWTKVNHNQNIVCNSAMIVAALAIMDDEPELSQRVLDRAKESIRNGLETFGPDGGWPEGPTYWTYATRYLAYAYSSLDCATGNDWGLSNQPGVSKTGLFRMYVEGPDAQAFNFGDSSENVSNSAQMMWMARKFQRPEYASWETQTIGRDVGIFDLLWYRPSGGNDYTRLPLDAKFRGPEMVSFRGSWTDPNATFVAFKGGDMEFRHSHLDLGTFVLDALGERWAIDLGSDSYDLPDYFGSKRWNYYRCNTRGHNTITIDNRNQETKGKSPIVTYYSSQDRSNAIIDLHDAYHDDARQALRGIALINDKQVLVQDELDLSDSADVAWNFHTNADVRVSGSTATLRQNGKTMTAQILSPAGAKFEVLNSIKLPAPQEALTNVRKLYIRVPNAKKKVTIAVLFTPGDTRGKAPDVTPLSQWPITRPNNK